MPALLLLTAILLEFADAKSGGLLFIDRLFVVIVLPPLIIRGLSNAISGVDLMLLEY